MLWDIYLGVFILVFGVLAVFRPKLLFKAEKFSPKRAARKERFLKKIGILLIILGIADLVLVPFHK